MKGYMGKILRVDLSQGRVEAKNLDENLAKKFIGGSGLATKILADETGPETDPLGPENRLILMTGPFAATRLLPRGAITCYEIPLTGHIRNRTREEPGGLSSNAPVSTAW